MSRLQLVLKAGWDARSDPTDTFFDDVPDPYINDDLMVKLLQSMTLTGTPWEQFQQVIATAASMSQTAKAPKASLRNLGWESIAERFIVPKTLPDQLNLKTGELLDRYQAATAQERCEEWAKFIKTMGGKHNNYLVRRSALSSKVQDMASIARYHLKELKYIRLEINRPLWNDETPPFERNEKYKEIWSHAQFLARMGMVNDYTLLYVLTRAVQYPFDVKQATLLLETMQMTYNMSASDLLNKAVLGPPDLEPQGNQNVMLLFDAIRAGNEALNFVLNLNATLPDESIDELVYGLVSSNMPRKLETAMEMLTTMRNLSNWKIELGDDMPMIQSWQDFMNLRDGYGYHPDKEHIFYKTLDCLYKTLPLAILHHVSTDYFKTLADVYLERISAVFKFYDAPTMGRKLLINVCEASKEPGMVAAVRDMKWAPNAFKAFYTDIELAKECFQKVNLHNRAKAQMLDELKSVFPMWFENANFKRFLLKGHDEDIDEEVGEWVYRNMRF